MNASELNTQTKGWTSFEKVPSVMSAPSVADPVNYVPISSIDDLYPHLKDEHLAGSFKSLVCNTAQDISKPMPIFKTYEFNENGLSGWKGTCTFSERTFNCVGIMQSAKQAEASASEVALRMLGYLPQLQYEQDFVIQPYRGGITPEQNKVLVTHDRKKFNYCTLMTRFLREVNLPPVQYCVKRRDLQPVPNLYGVAGVGKKVLQSSTSSKTAGEARQDVSKYFLDYFGIENIEDINECKFSLRKKAPYNCTVVAGIQPKHFSPQSRPHWIQNSFQEPMTVDGENIPEEKLADVFVVDEPFDCGTIYQKFIDFLPSFKHLTVKSNADLSVAEVLSEHVVVIGNHNFSIKLFCENNLLFSKNRKRSVKLLPGHQIRGLVSSYKSSHPYYQVYLKAEYCFDLVYPNPPATVVTRCGAVLLMHDGKSSDNIEKDIFMLLKKKSGDNPLCKRIGLLVDYLNSLIDQKEVPLHLTVLTQNIDKWRVEQLKHLREMSMDSMKQFLSTFVIYDDRWNEIFATSLSHELILLKETCANEIERRENGDHIEPEEEIVCSLPTMEFKPRLLLSTGPYVESSAMCMYRGLTEQTGLSLSIDEIESCICLDVPTQSLNSHRGDVIRYYIHADSVDLPDRQGSNAAEYQSLLQPGESWFVEKEGHVASHEPSDDVDMELQSLTNGVDKRKIIQEECHWLKLSEARTLCPEYEHIFESKEFKEVIHKLQQKIESSMRVANHSSSSRFPIHDTDSNDRSLVIGNRSPLHNRLQPLDRFPSSRDWYLQNSHHVRYSSQNDRYALHNDRSPLHNDRSPLQSNRYPLQNNRYPLHNDRYSLQNDRYHLQNDRYDAQQLRNPLQYDRHRLPSDRLYPMHHSPQPRHPSYNHGDGRIARPFVKYSYSYTEHAGFDVEPRRPLPAVNRDFY